MSTSPNVPPLPVISDQSDANDLQSSDIYEMEDSTLLNDGKNENAQKRQQGGIVKGVARHTLGLILLLFVVFLWTASNFLGSSIFADNSYAKPFFLTYMNTATFMFCLIPSCISSTTRKSRDGTLPQHLRDTFSLQFLKSLFTRTPPSTASVSANEDESEAFIKPASRASSTRTTIADSDHLGAFETARLSLVFCLLWFLANYFAMACLQHTTVASTTILTSTSSMWTLLIGSITRTEKFTYRKLCGVLASLAGIVLISQIDLKSPQTNDADSNSPSLLARALDDFPDKPATELALGDALALLSAIIYGFYTIILKRTTLTAAPLTIHMPTFFGFVGMFNAILLLPLFPILHYTSLERFQWPPTLHIWLILAINSFSSLLSDICWAYAMVFTSPLVVTVGLSLTIPLSLVGEMIIQGRFESWGYWVGAGIVVGSFVFVEREEKGEEEEGDERTRVGDEEQGDVGEPGPAVAYDEDIDGERSGVRISRERSPALLDDESDGEEDGYRDRMYRQSLGVDEHS